MCDSEQAILNMRISVEVKRKLYEMIMQIEKQAKEEAKDKK